jgi:dCMP deaminase
MIIGITGMFCSGKDTVAEILQGMNFFHVSFSDQLRDELKTRNHEITRDSLIIIGNELRTKHGADILARKALENVKCGENYVFTSIRNSHEVKLLQQRSDFLLVNVIAPDKERLARIIARNRENDPKNLRELQEKEKMESSNDTNKQQLHTVTKMAKVTIQNNSTLDKLKLKTEKLVNDYIYKLQDERPNWDEYFMSITEQVKMRASCMSAKKAAIIVRDKMIISTGYNGSPKGIKHCMQGGCKRCTLRHLGKIKSGVYNEPCICCHSEENAIVQAAYNGISTDNATMYTTFTPCVTCAKMIINAGINRVVTKIIYPDDSGRELLSQAKIKLEVID